MSSEEIQVIESSALQAMQRAEIDSTIATAKRFPRDMKRALQRIEEMATLTVAIAEECHYSIPRTGKGGRRVNIQGPSIRFAEIVASQWGNLRIASRVIEISEKQVVAQGICLDLETNVAYDKENRKSIISKDGRRYSEDVIVTNANACAAIAERNAVLKVVPKPLWNPIYEAALVKISGADNSPLDKRWQRAVSWFQSRGIGEVRLRAAIEIAKPGDLTQEKMQQLVGWRNAIEQDADELENIFGSDAKDFPDEQPKPATKKKTRRTRGAPKEVNAEPAPAEAAPAEAEPAQERRETLPERHAREREKTKLWGEMTQLKSHQFSDDEWQEIREAAGVELIDMACSNEELEEAIRKAEEIITGRRE